MLLCARQSGFGARGFTMAPGARGKADEGGKSDGSGWVLVTGASAGIGRELARAFASKKRDLVLLARSQETTMELARELIAKNGVKVKTIPADLSVHGAAEAIFDGLSAKDI